MTIDNIKAGVTALWRGLVGVYRYMLPSIMIIIGLFVAYAVGRQGLSEWWLIPAYLFAGFALGAAQDRAEAIAKTVWAERFLRLIETDHDFTVTITHNVSEVEDALRARKAKG